MNEQFPQTPSPEEHPEEPKPSGAFKTLERDVEEFVRGERPSIISLLAREAQKPPLELEKRKRSWAWLKNAALILVFLILGGLGVYGYIIIKSQIPPPPPPPPPPVEERIKVRAERKFEIQTTTPLETRQTLLGLSQRKEETGTLTEVIFLGKNNERVGAGPALEVLGLVFPAEIRDEIEDARVFLYYSFFGGRMVVVMALKDSQKIRRLMEIEESDIRATLEKVFLEAGANLGKNFSNQSYRNIDYRVSEGNIERDEALIWSVVPSRDLLIISSSQRGFELMIERILER